MASQIDIANGALDLLGESSISDITDTSIERAVMLNRIWDGVRDQLLREKNWRFAIERASLAADVSTPAWGFDLQYSIDGDVVRVIQVDQYYPAAVLDDYINADTAPFRIEADKILTNIEAPLKVRWVINSVDIGLWDPLFANVMSCDLADAMSTRLTSSETIKARIKAERRDAMQAAQRANAVETPPVKANDTSWITSRIQV